MVEYKGTICIIFRDNVLDWIKLFYNCKTVRFDRESVLLWVDVPVEYMFMNSGGLYRNKMNNFAR